MRYDKLTVKAQEALADARDLAVDNKHAEVLPDHMLAALIAQEDGVVPRLLQRLGADARVVTADLDRALSKLSKVHGTSVDVGLSRGLKELLDQARSRPRR